MRRRRARAWAEPAVGQSRARHEPYRSLQQVCGGGGGGESLAASFIFDFRVGRSGADDDDGERVFLSMMRERLVGEDEGDSLVDYG